MSSQEQQTAHVVVVALVLAYVVAVTDLEVADELQSTLIA